MANTRELVLEILMTSEKEQSSCSQMIKDVLQKYDYLETGEKAFIKRLAEGTLEREIEIDYLLDAYSSVPVRKMKPLIRNLMRLSVYQILYMDKVPDKRAINEALKLAEKRKFNTLKGFVNGVLRKMAADKESGAMEKLYPNYDKEPLKYLSVRFSMPLFLLNVWEKEYGLEKTVQMTEALMQVHPVCVRVLPDDISETPEEQGYKSELSLVSAWENSGIKVEKHPLGAHLYLLSGLDGVSNLAGFAEGLVTVQDASSVLAVLCAGIGPDDLVLDPCSAPGGKTSMAAVQLRQMGGKGRVIAGDVSEYKTERIEENLERMHLSDLVRVRVWDARIPDASLEGKCDKVLLDVPCSGLGVIGKKRDIKYNISETSLQDILTLQREIIDAVVPAVKKEGILLYSTCTVRIEENEENVQYICEKYGFTAENLNPYLPDLLQGDDASRGTLQLFPGEHPCDGFFIARLRKN